MADSQGARGACGGAAMSEKEVVSGSALGARGSSLSQAREAARAYRDLARAWELLADAYRLQSPGRAGTSGINVHGTTPSPP